MSLVWHFYWPAVAFASLVGVITGWLAFGLGKISASRKRWAIPVGLLAATIFTAIWHGPIGAGDRFASTMETAFRRYLDQQELPMVQAHLDRGPLSRRVTLSGPADSFQQTELSRIFANSAGVSGVRWANPPSQPAAVK